MITYWSQWSRSDLMSMQGLDDDQEHYRDDDQSNNHHDRETEEQLEFFCSGPMDYLGLSWRDFM